MLEAPQLTIKLNFRKKSMPNIGLTTSATIKHQRKLRRKDLLLSSMLHSPMTSILLPLAAFNVTCVG